MASFPRLKTEAVMQYPAARSLAFATEVVRFVDGSEQRYRDFGAPLRRWTIRLDLLDEAELTALEEFYTAQQGAFGNFSFTDPWDGRVMYSLSKALGFSLDTPWEKLAEAGERRGQTALVVRENRS